MTTCLDMPVLSAATTRTDMRFDKLSCGFITNLNFFESPAHRAVCTVMPPRKPTLAVTEESRPLHDVLCESRHCQSQMKRRWRNLKLLPNQLRKACEDEGIECLVKGALVLSRRLPIMFINSSWTTLQSRRTVVMEWRYSPNRSIDIGDSLPSLTLKNERDEDIDVSTLTAKKGVVFFLVPKADTRELNYVRLVSGPLLTTIIMQRDAQPSLRI